MPARNSTTPKPGRASRRAPKKTAKKAASRKLPKVKRATSKKAAPTKKDTTKPKGVTLKPPFAPGKSITGPITLRQRFSLLVLSPSRFPLDIERLAIQSARIGGMAFVLLGAILTFLHTPGAAEHITQSMLAEQQLAQIGTSGDYGGGDDASLTNHNFYSQTYYQGSYSTSYEIAASYQADILEADRKLKQKIVVERGNEYVESVAFYYTTGTKAKTESLIGRLAQNSSEAYEYESDISMFAAGDYTFMAEVTLRDGTKKTDSSWVKTVAIEESIPVIDLNTKYLPESNVIQVEVEIDEASDVVIYGSNTRDAAGGKLGAAAQSSEGLWSFRWDTSKTSGEYTLYAKVVVAGTTYESDHQTINFDVDVDETVRTNIETDELADVEEQVSEPGALKLYLDSDSTLSGTADLKIRAAEPTYIEVYAHEATRNLPIMIGKARKDSNSYWIYEWDTTQYDDGVYSLYVIAGFDAGRLKSDEMKVEVVNVPAQLDSEVETDSADTQESSEPAPEYNQSYYQSLYNAVPSTTEPGDSLSEVVEDAINDEEVALTSQALLQEYAVDIKSALHGLSVAIQSGDESRVVEAQQRLMMLRATIVQNSNEASDPGLLSRIDEKLSQKFTTLQERVETTERIVKERTGDAVVRDTDNDGITDYDEEALFKTNPETADSDNDGISDGDELLAGRNPNDETEDARIEFESPQEEGLERSDLLVVNTVETLSGSELAQTNSPISTSTPIGLRARFAGTGLPNSFVTLYIFSTPTIVTVKTEADGSWSYTFDKELEDGEHEVYVGVTDNAGRVLAKSEPLRFIKTAEAFTPVAQAAPSEPVVTQSAPASASLFTDKMILLVSSISIIVIGLILILLGHFLRSSRQEHLVAENFTTTAVT